MIGRLVARWRALRDRAQHPDPLEREVLDQARRRAALADVCRRPDVPHTCAVTTRARRLSGGKAPR